MSNLTTTTLVEPVVDAVQSQIVTYLEGVQSALEKVSPGAVSQVINFIFQAGQRGSFIYIIGNGGSAATASHFACDLSKGTRRPGLPAFRAIALNDAVPQLTAWANDTDYDNCFAGQLESLARPGDLLIAISGSGNSRNILRAVEVARNLELTTIGLAGFNGGQLRELVDYCLVVPAPTIEQVEDIHLVLEHSICTALRYMLAEHLTAYQC